MTGRTHSQHGQPASTSSAAFAMPTFLAVVDRLEAAVDAETDALSHHLPADLADLNRRKRQGLFELSRIMRAFAGSGPQAEARERLGGLAAKLERNRYVLDIQLRAVREIADIIARSMKDAESDGTYSMLAWRS